MMPRSRSLLLFLTLSSALGCGGAGLYGHSPDYEELDAEEQAIANTTVVSYEDVRRDPADYAASEVAWFGVVTNVNPQTGSISATYRTLAARNLCSDETDSSCRVTVSARPGGPFTTHIAIRPEDREGPDRIWPGSLVRVVGSPTGDFDDDGGPALQGSYYRHWPRGTYVTTAARGSMRR